MGKAAAARKLVSAAAYGGGGLSLVGASLYGVLRAEAKVARVVIGTADSPRYDATGWYGHGRPGPAIKLALLGDSSAAGYGVADVTETPGAILASGLAERADRMVYLKQLAVVGAKSGDLPPQVDQAVRLRPDLTVIFKPSVVDDTLPPDTPTLFDPTKNTPVSGDPLSPEFVFLLALPFGVALIGLLGELRRRRSGR